MIPLWNVHLVIAGTWALWYLLLAYSSFLYYFFKHQIQSGELESFGKELSWPLRWAVHRKGLIVWFLDETHPLDGPPKRINSVTAALGWRLVSGLMSLVPLGGYLSEIIRATATPETISAAVGLLVSSYLLYRAWFFGYKLKDMQAAVSKTGNVET